MKGLARIPGLKIWTLLLLIAGSLISCNVLEEEEQDCALYVRFKYDMNMLNADAFNTNVKSLTLYVFKDGKFVFQKTAEGSLLERDGYRMRLDEISYRQKDEYDYITWAGLADNDAFTVPLLQPGDSKETLYCRLNREQGRAERPVAEVNMNLQGLYHGMVEGKTIGRAASSVAEDEVLVSLTKNTNTVRVILQHLSGEPINVNDFEYTITDAENGLMNYNNALLAENDSIIYSAWDTRTGTAIGVEDVTGDGQINVALAELSIARLMTDKNPQLTIIEKASGNIVLSVPLVDYALMVKGNYTNAPQFGYEMPDQEYLDREDEYTMIFFHDERNYRMNAFININSWRIVLQDTEL